VPRAGQLPHNDYALWSGENHSFRPHVRFGTQIDLKKYSFVECDRERAIGFAHILDYESSQRM